MSTLSENQAKLHFSLSSQVKGKNNPFFIKKNQKGQNEKLFQMQKPTLNQRSRIPLMSQSIQMTPYLPSCPLLKFESSDLNSKTQFLNLPQKPTVINNRQLQLSHSKYSKTTNQTYIFPQNQKLENSTKEIKQRGRKTKAFQETEKFKNTKAYCRRAKNEGARLNYQM